MRFTVNLAPLMALLHHYTYRLDVNMRHIVPSTGVSLGRNYYGTIK